jgi:hypothetical protein
MPSLLLSAEALTSPHRLFLSSPHKLGRSLSDNAVALHLLPYRAGLKAGNTVTEARMDDDKITSGILGLGGAPVPKEPGDPTAEHDEESAARRRARMREEEAETLSEKNRDREHKGATGIDMGAGGEGTGIKPD